MHHIQLLERRVTDLEAKLQQMGQSKRSSCSSDGTSAEEKEKELENTQENTICSRNAHESKVIEEKGVLTFYPHASEAAKEYLKSMKSSVRRVNYKDFNNRFSLDDSRYAIEVLMLKSDSQDVYEKDLEIRSNVQSEKRMSVIQEYFANHRADSSSPGSWPEIIRINSKPLLSAFHNIDPTIPTGADAISFAVPFGPLLQFHETMGNKLTELRSRWGGNVDDSAAGKPAVDEGSICEDTSSNGIRALRDLSCYVKFMENDIIPLYRDLSCSNTKTKVRFGDLWWVMRLSDDIYYPTANKTSPTDLEHRDRHYQMVWRVHPCQVKISESGGFGLRCYCIDFDGKTFGPTVRYFHIDYFEGEREIRSLPFYPLRFASDAEGIAEVGRKRGQKFLDCISQKQMAYYGWALQYREESPTNESSNMEQGYVSSNVIIDFAESFKVHRKWRIQHDDRTMMDEDDANYIEVSRPARWWKWAAGPDSMAWFDINGYIHKEPYIPF